MLRVSAVAVTSTLLAASLATAQPPPVPDIPFQKFVLENGLTLIVHEDHKAPVVAVHVWYHVGSKDERPGRSGFAHLFEHLMYQGSEHADEEYPKILQRLGSSEWNGATWEDRTNYFQTVPVTALDTVLWLEADRMGHFMGAVTQAKLDEQRGVVQNEKRQWENKPYGRSEYAIVSAMFPRGHPYSWPVIGSMGDLDAASLADVRDWFATYYGPSNAVLVVVGDVAAADVRTRVERYFGDIPPGPPVARHAEPTARRSGFARQVQHDRVPQVRLYHVWNTPPWGTPDDDALTVAAAVLGGGKGSRLYRRLVLEERLATDVRAYVYGMEIGGLFLIETTLSPGRNPAEAERVVSEEVARLADGPAAPDLERARAGLIAPFLRGTELVGGFEGKAELLAIGEVLRGDAGFARARMDRLQATTAATVGAAARHWLSDGPYILEVRPLGDAARGDAPADLTKRPEPGPPPAGRLPPLERSRLASGAELIVARRPGAALVDVRLLLDAGHASDEAGRPGLAKLAADMLDEGTATRTALQIGDELQRLGATLEATAAPDTTTLALSAPRATLDAALAVLADVVVAPSFPAAEFERVREMQLAAIEQEGVEPFTLAQRVLPPLLYGPAHPYGASLTGSGTRAAVAALTRDDVVEWHRRWVRPGSATIVVVGDVALEDVRRSLEAGLAAWQRGAAPTKAIAPATRTAAPGLYLLDRPGAPQSVILAGQLMPPRANPQAIPQRVLNSVFGGEFSARLNMNLREDKHWAYFSFAWVVDARAERPLVAFTPVQTDRTAEAVRELLKEFSDIGGGRPPTPGEIDLARAGLTLPLAGRWETVRAASTAIGEIVSFGLPADYYDTFADKVRATTVAEVTAAGRLIDPAQLVWVIAGDRAVIEPGLRALGLGVIRIIDADGTEGGKP